MLRLVVLAVLLVFATTALALEVSIRDLIATPERFDGQPVTLHGTIGNIQRRVSGRGNAYFILDLAQEGATVRVFSFGDAACKSGGMAIVDGRFDRVKKVGRYTFHNEVTATRVTCP